VDDFLSNPFKGIDLPQLFRSGQYLCTAPLTAKSTADDFLSNSFNDYNNLYLLAERQAFLFTAIYK